MIIRDTGAAAGTLPTISDSAMDQANRMADDLPVDAATRDRQPKGDHNRRLSLGLDLAEFAAEAGVGEAELRDYEQTAPDHDFDLVVATRVGAALERLEANPPPSQKVVNGPTA